MLVKKRRRLGLAGELQLLEKTLRSNSPEEGRLLALDQSLNARKGCPKRSNHLRARHVSRREKQDAHPGFFECFQLHWPSPNSAVFRQQDPVAFSGFLEQKLVGDPFTESVTAQVYGESELAKPFRKLLSSDVLVQEKRRKIKRYFLAARRGWRP